MSRSTILKQLANAGLHGGIGTISASFSKNGSMPGPPTSSLQNRIRPDARPCGRGCRPGCTVGEWMTATRDNGIIPSVSVTWRLEDLMPPHGCCRLAMKRVFVTIACVAMMPGSAVPDSGPVSRPERYCAPLTNAVSAQLSGSKVGFVRSYDPGANESALPAVLASTAFVYDNALAVIALVACGDMGSATVIGNALSAAVRNDRTFTDGRVRNA